LGLGGDEVHLWRADLGLALPRLDALESIVSDDERARADRFHAPQDSERFLAGRAILRIILGRYAGESPESLRFRYGVYGKPALFREEAASPLRFNVSHSGPMAVYAVALQHEIGVDVEHIQEDVARQQVAEYFFARREAATLRSLPRALQTRAFYACWTRKEAYVKARGAGLVLPLDQFEVSVDPDEPAALLRVAEDPRAPRRWSLHDLPLGPEYVGALAAESRRASLRYWMFRYM